MVESMPRAEMAMPYMPEKVCAMKMVTARQITGMMQLS
jgi:hypothetical protein